MKEKYGIEITYSWGDEEEGLYGNYDTPEDAYEAMCQLAAKEAFVQGEEYLPENTCSVYFNPAKKQIDLHYESDNTWCYYRIVPHEIVEEKKYTVNFLAEVELDVKATEPEKARKIAEKMFKEYQNKTFPYAYLSEIKSICDENGNE